ncbi:phosphatidylinositol N-acetylglucosaminyltransferase subunit P [Cephus cinctus]|uniref:Phosphatidylinositol N-acetylglucosaminyltransferase subunit P n=1 Tax=Cephus cinctus TaxID=211228 RepID=A0AAJ7C2B9_CEPCN|nr:phosphatidylinositol N-acetylglucosaminyltransferase subunit P [Cephus cinctus]
MSASLTTIPKIDEMAEHTPAPYRPRAVYGYALYIGSNIFFILYLVWALVPDYILHEQLGLTYWPLKYWAVAIPIWGLTAAGVFAFIIYPAINMRMTPDIDDIKTINDKYSLSNQERIPGGIPPVSDIPITEVCRKLYLPDSKIKNS